MTFPRFSLRLLLVAVAVLCAWLAWERSGAVRRHTAAEMLRSDPAFRVHTAAEVRSAMAGREPKGAKYASVSRLRGWMSDVPIQAIAYYEDDADPAKVEMAKRLFPEALVRPISNPLPRSQRAPPPAP
jgi:hypothetical protein